MKKRSLAILIISILSSNLFCQILQNDVYDAINQILEINNVCTLSKTAKPLIIKAPSQNEFIKWCISSGNERISVSQIDSLFLIQQIPDCPNLKWNKNKLIKSIRLKNKATHYFTIPLFLNKEMDLLIVFHQEYSGPLAAEGKFELYRKVKNVWKLINFSIEFVS